MEDVRSSRLASRFVFDSAVCQTILGTFLGIHDDFNGRLVFPYTSLAI